MVYSESHLILNKIDLDKQEIMLGRHISKFLGVNASQSLYFHQGDWYHLLKRFPGALFDKRGYLLFDTEEDYLTSKYLKIGKRLHVKGGISSVPGYIAFSVEELIKIEEKFFSMDVEVALRKLRTSNLVIRNRKLVQELKILYSNKCQICKEQIRTAKETYYIEVHHIKPVGAPHNGPDIKENMICVCPNCHVLLDYNAILINLDCMVVEHKIDKKYVNYHNSLFVH